MATEREVGEILNDIYYDAGNPASFGGIAKLSKASGVSQKKTKEWLMKQDTYSLHKPIRLNFPRRKVLSYGIGELMQCDLVDMSKFAKQNKNNRFLLTCIDVLSKKAFIIAIKKKNADSLVEAFKKLFRQTKTIINLQTDEGKEFYNRKVKSLFKQHGIHHYSSHSEHKASVIERFNLTLRNKLHRIFTHRGSYKYIDVLDKVVKSYNESIHRSTGYAPNDVTPELESTIFKKLYSFQPVTKYTLELNDQVRITKAKKTFRRGYLPNWSNEVFVIFKRYPSNPPTFILKDLSGEIVKGRFYAHELQKVIKDATSYWRVERVLKTRGIGTNKEHFVKWKGFPSKFNSWVKEQWMTRFRIST